MEGEKVEEQKTKNKKDCLFSFSKINKYFIIPFLCPVFSMIIEIIYSSSIISDNTKNRDLLFNMIDCLSTLVGGLLYFVASMRTKTEETRNNAIIYKETSHDIEYIYNPLELEKNYCIIITYLIIMSIIFSFVYIILECQNIIIEENTHKFERRLYYLFFLPLFSKFILKSDIFSHQIVSLIISYIGTIFLYIPIIKEFTTDDILINILKLVVSIFNSLVFVLIKILTNKYYLSPYLCQLYLGFFSAIFTFIGYLIFSLIKEGNISIITDSFNFSDIDNILLFIIFYTGIFVFGIIYNTLLFLTIYYFTPTLLMITDIINPLLIWIYSLVIKEKEEFLSNIIMKSIGYSIIIFGSLIYNEIIICNFFGFNKNTKKCIEERQREELLSLRKSENLNNSKNSFDESDSSDKSDIDIKNDNNTKEND